MRHSHLAPWRWGGLSRQDAERPYETLRRDMESFQRNMDRLFEGLAGGRTIMLPEYWATGEMAPRLDESEDDKAYHIDIELPGMDEKDIDVMLTDGLLTISGEKKAEEGEKDEHFHRRERAYGSFRRTLPIPGAVDEDKIKAVFHDGVLSIDLPKTKEAQTKVRHIEVKHG